jgi:HK97 gp10 family phage protein
MAKCEVKLPEDFLLKCSKLGEHTDSIIEKVLEDGGKVTLKQARSNLQSVIGNTVLPSKSTGTLVGALGLSPAKQDDKGWNVKIGFSEPRRGGGVNAKVATILEYGRHGQRPRPFMKPAKIQSKAASIEAMRSRLESEINSL